MDIIFTKSGLISFSGHGIVSNYTAGTQISLDTYFDLDTHLYNAFINNTQVVTGAAFNNPAHHISSVTIGFQHSSFDQMATGVLDGMMQVDNFLFTAEAGSVPEPETLALFSVGLLGLISLRRKIS